MEPTASSSTVAPGVGLWTGMEPSLAPRGRGGLEPTETLADIITTGFAIIGFLAPTCSCMFTRVTSAGQFSPYSTLSGVTTGGCRADVHTISMYR